MGYQCDLCDASPFEKLSSTRAHIQGSKGPHEGIGFADAEQHISEVGASSPSKDPEQSQQQSSGQASSAGGGVVPPDHRGGSQSDTGASDDCCDNPSREGSAGDVYELENGDRVRLESGDKICVNCDTIHE